MEQLNMILLVEDDENDIIITKRKIVKSSIEAKNIVVTKTLADTMNFLEKNHPDVVLLDLNLEDSRGLDTLYKIRVYYDGIIVVLTSIDEEVIGINAIRQGADEYLVKNQINEKLISKAIYYSIERRLRQARQFKAYENLDKLENLMKGKA